MIWELLSDGDATVARRWPLTQANGELTIVYPFLYSRPIHSRLHGFHRYEFNPARSDTPSEEVLKFKSSGFLHQAEWQINTDASKNRGASHFKDKR